MQYQRIKASKVPQWGFYRLCFSRAVTCFLLLNIFKRTLTAAIIRLNASAKVGTDQSAVGFGLMARCKPVPRHRPTIDLKAQANLTSTAQRGRRDFNFDWDFDYRGGRRNLFLGD
jgi:hypothetical protein